MTEREQYRYDVCISFGGETGREYAHDLRRLLTANGVRVFLDDCERWQLIGQNLAVRLQQIYRDECRYAIAIVDEEWVRRAWPTLEREAILERRLHEPGYLIPLRVDDVDVPGVSGTTGYADLRTQTLPDVVETLLRRFSAEGLRLAARQPRAFAIPYDVAEPKKTSPRSSSLELARCRAFGLPQIRHVYGCGQGIDAARVSIRYADKKTQSMGDLIVHGGMDAALREGMIPLLAQRKQAAKDRGHVFDNNPGAGLWRYIFTEFGEEITFEVIPTNYYTFAATNLSLDEKVFEMPKPTMRDRYEEQLDDPQPDFMDIPFSNRLGMGGMIVCADGRTVFGARKRASAVLAQRYQGSIAEGCRPDKDETADHGGISLARWVTRAAREELKLVVDPGSVRLINFFIYVPYAQPMLACYAESPESSDVVLRRYDTGAIQDKWEMHPQTEAFGVEGMLSALRDNNWANSQAYVLLSALIHVHGWEKVTQGLTRIFPEGHG